MHAVVSNSTIMAHPLASDATMRQRTILRSVLALGLLAVGCSGCNGLSSLATTEKGFFSNGDIQLHYAFDIPKSDGPFPVVVLGHGSGRVTANRNARRAPRLLEHGIAVFRYDKRGVGKSDGEYSKAFSRCEGRQSLLSLPVHRHSTLFAGIF